MDCFGSRALRSIYGQLACLRLTWVCLLQKNADDKSTDETSIRTLRRWERHSAGIRALAQCSCLRYTSAFCALQAPVLRKIRSFIFALLASSTIPPHSYSLGPASKTFHNSQSPIPFSRPLRKPLPNCHKRWTTRDTRPHSSGKV